jgi:putative SOS response-associated peptidase YedK
MCNLYSLTKGQSAIRDLFAVKNDRTGSLPLFPGIFPDQMAPIVRGGPDGERELVMGALGDAPTATVRRPAGQEPPKRRKPALARRAREAQSLHRSCNVVLRVRGHEATQDAQMVRAERGPLFAFAGLWTPWRGVRGPKSAPIEGQHELFGFLTTAPNAIVAPIHPKAMPVILTTPAEVDLSLAADARRPSNCSGRCLMTR